MTSPIPSMSRTSSSSSSTSFSRGMNEDAISREYVFRLIDAGATGLADILIAEVEEQQQQQQTTTNSNTPSLLGETNNKNVPLETSSNRRMELVKEELVPISWMMWIVNIISLSFYINEPGTVYFAGIDLINFFQMCCLRGDSTTAESSNKKSMKKKKGEQRVCCGCPHLINFFQLCCLRRKPAAISSNNKNKKKTGEQRVCCGCRRSTLPTFHRINNSYVTWDATNEVLIGTPPSTDEFGFLKITIFQQFFLYMIPSIISAICYMVFPNIEGFSATPIDYLASRFDTMLFVHYAFPAVWTVIPCVIVPLSILLVLGPSLVGSRDGSLPTFLPHLLKASAPEFMISYSWKGGKSQFARALAEVLPNAWIDVRSLVGGQLVSNETRSNSSHARVTILILDRHYLESRNCAGEFLSVVTKRKHKGSKRCHQTVVLIDESFLQSSSGIKVDSDEMQEHRRLLEASGEYVVTPTNPAINWRDITTILKEVGCKVFHTPDELLEHLQEHACRATENKDISLCIHWWMKYGSSSFGGSSAHVADYRVPWNIVGNKSRNTKRKLQVKSWCKRATRTCCQRRPYARVGAFSWVENSVSTGAGGAWLPYDASSEPQAHVDITPQYVLGWLVAVALSSLLPGLAIACFWTIDTDVTILIQTQQCLEVFPSIGGGILTSFFCFCAAFFGCFFYVTDVFTPSNILHSSVLFRFFAFSEIQDVAEEEEGNQGGDNHEVSNKEGILTASSSSSSSTGPIEVMTMPDTSSRVGVVTSTMSTLSARNTHTPIASNAAQDGMHQIGMTTSTTNPLHDLSSSSSSSNPSNNLLSPTFLHIRDPQPNTTNTATTAMTTAKATTNLAQSTGHRRKFSIQFAHDDSPIVSSINNFNAFLAQYVFGFDPEADKENGYPGVLSAKSILENPAHPLRLTVYVFFLDSPVSQKAWEKAMQDKNNRWQPEHVVLITTFDTLNTGGDSASAAGILKKLLVLKDERSNREGDKEMVKEILHAFTVLDRGEIFPVDAATIPSCQAAREALREILKSLGFVLVPSGYVSPRSLRGSNARSIPLLVPTLGPLLTYGPTSTLMKQRTLQALQESSNILTSSESRPPVTRAISMNNNNNGGVEDTDTGVMRRSTSTSSPTSSRVMRRSPSPTKKLVAKARPRMQEHMLIVYNTKKGTGGVTAEMPNGSPYRGLVPAVLEAVASKLGHILKLNGEELIEDLMEDLKEE